MFFAWALGHRTPFLHECIESQVDAPLNAGEYDAVTNTVHCFDINTRC